MATFSQTKAVPLETTRSQKLYFAVWRWHFYAGLYVIPFFLMLAVTGLMMMYVNFFAGRDGERIAVPLAETTVTVAQQAEAATTVVPGQIVQYILPRQEGLAAVFKIDTDSGQRLVAVNPYTGEVVESWESLATWYSVADAIHGKLMLGDFGDRLIEISAGLGMILVVTGVYIWWPRGTGAAALLPNFTARGRALWKNLHAVVGFWGSILTVLFLLSGLAWSGIWGHKYVQSWSTFPAAKWDNVPLSDDIHAKMNHAHHKDVPWALEQTQMPASGSDAGVTGTPEGAPVTADSLVSLGRDLGIEGRFRVVYPSSDDGVWTINRDTMNSDSNDPFSDITVHVDQHTGKILADVRFADYSIAGKVMAAGIPAHMGLLGTWNFVLNTLYCLSVIFLCISGAVMWFIRRPANSMRLAAPPAPSDMPFWKGAALIAVLMALAFPLVGLTLLAVLAIDVLLISNIPALKRALS